MAMDGDALAGEIKSAYEAVMSSKGITTSGGVDEDFVKALANAIVNHIKNNAEVSTTVTGTLPSGPVAASGSGDVS